MRNKRGLTLLEIIIILVVIGAAIPALLTAFARIVGTGANVKTMEVATNLASAKMEELIKDKKFADIVSISPTDFTGTFSDYSYQIVVEYVDGSDLNTPVGSPTDFKRVKVIVTRHGMTSFNITFTTILTNLGY